MTIIVAHKLYLKFQSLIGSEEGQDLVEYALVCALLAFGIVAGMSNVAKGLDTAFSNISSTMGTYTT
jgi:pilus assembly protein Flp/PilA